MNTRHHDDRSVTEIVTAAIYAPDRGASLGIIRWPDETRGEAVRRRRAVARPVRDALRADDRRRAKVGWQRATEAHVR